MKRTTVALLAALEALIVVAIGLAVALVPLTLLWAIQYSFAVDWLVFWRAAVDVWLLGHGADLTVTLDPATIARVGVLEAGAPFTVSLAPLGFGLLTVLLGARTGRRAAESGWWLIAVLSSTATVLLLSIAATASAMNAVVSPSILGGATGPALVHLVGLFAGIVGVRLRGGAALVTGPAGDRLGDLAGRLGARGTAILSASLRGGAIVGVGIVGVAAVTVAIVLALSFGTVIGLYESSGVGVTGGIAVTIAQLAYLPNIIVWCASWLVGPGFALGVGTTVSPAGTLIGPVPGVPILGAVPTGDLPFGFVALLVPVLVGFLGALSVRSSLVRALGGRGVAGALALGALGIAVTSSVILGALALVSRGAIGPERLAEMGPAPLAVMGATFVSVAIAALAGMASGRSPSESAGAVDAR